VRVRWSDVVVATARRRRGDLMIRTTKVTCETLFFTIPALAHSATLALKSTGLVVASIKYLASHR
jgi:hypothetical protein